MKTSTPKSLIPVYFDAESGAVHMLRFKEFYPRFRSFTHSSSCPNLQNEKVDKIKEQKKKLKAAFPELFLKGSNYKPTKIIGSGAYSVVCEAIDLRTNTVVAIKRIQQLFNNSKEAIRTLREIKLMHHLNDYSNIIHLRDVILPVTAAKFQNLLIVLDKMECDLANKIEKTGKLSLPLRRKIFRGIVNGLHLIHRANVLHRDLRPKNILLNYKPKQHSPAPPSLPSPSSSSSSSSSSTADMNQNMENKTENNDLMNEGDQKSNRCEENHVHDGEDINEVVICDFGMGRSAGLHLSLLEFTTATLYTPPEGLLGISDYGKAVDVWGIGCILAEMIIGHRLVTANSHREILKFVFQLVGIPTYQQIDDLLPLDDLNNSEAKSIIDELNSSFDMPSFSSFFYSNDEEIDEMEVDLLKKIFTFNPSNRITTSQLLDHPYFASLCKIDDLSNNSCPPFEYDDAELESLPTNQLQKIIFDRLSSLFPKEVSKTATM